MLNVSERHFFIVLRMSVY